MWHGTGLPDRRALSNRTAATCRLLIIGDRTRRKKLREPPRTARMSVRCLGATVGTYSTARCFVRVRKSFPVGWLASSNASPQRRRLGAHFVRPQPPTADQNRRDDDFRTRTVGDQWLPGHRYAPATGVEYCRISCVLAVVPDWDGLTLVRGAEFFDRRHRTWGHCLLVSLLLAIALGIGDYRFDFTGRWARLVTRPTAATRDFHTSRADRQRSYSGYAVWSTVSVLATLKA